MISEGHRFLVPSKDEKRQIYCARLFKGVISNDPSCICSGYFLDQCVRRKPYIESVHGQKRKRFWRHVEHRYPRAPTECPDGAHRVWLTMVSPSTSESSEPEFNQKIASPISLLSFMENYTIHSSSRKGETVDRCGTAGLQEHKRKILHLNGGQNILRTCLRVYWGCETFLYRISIRFTNISLGNKIQSKLRTWNDKIG